MCICFKLEAFKESSQVSECAFLLWHLHYAHMCKSLRGEVLSGLMITPNIYILWEPTHEHLSLKENQTGPSLCKQLVEKLKKRHKCFWFLWKLRSEQHTTSGPCSRAWCHFFSSCLFVVVEIVLWLVTCGKDVQLDHREENKGKKLKNDINVNPKRIHQVKYQLCVHSIVLINSDRYSTGCSRSCLIFVLLLLKLTLCFHICVLYVVTCMRVGFGLYIYKEKTYTSCQPKILSICVNDALTVNNSHLQCDANCGNWIELLAGCMILLIMYKTRILKLCK